MSDADTVQRAEILLTADQFQQYVLDWVKLDWNFSRVDANGMRVYAILVREPSGGTLTTLDEMEQAMVWFDSKYVNSVGSAANFQVNRGGEDFVNFLPDEEFSMNEGEQLSLYTYYTGSSGSTIFYFDYIVKVRIRTTQRIYRNDNAYSELTYEESIQDLIDVGGDGDEMS